MSHRVFFAVFLVRIRDARGRSKAKQTAVARIAASQKEADRTTTKQIAVDRATAKQTAAARTTARQTEAASCQDHSKPNSTSPPRFARVA